MPLSPVGQDVVQKVCPASGPSAHFQICSAALSEAPIHPVVAILEYKKSCSSADVIVTRYPLWPLKVRAVAAVRAAAHEIVEP